MLVAVFACIFGVYAWSQLAIDAYPLLSPVAAQVTTQVPGLAAEEIEQQITIPLERALNRHARPDQHALDQHVCAVSDQPAVSRRRRGLLGAPARHRTHRRRHSAAGGCSQALDAVTSPEGEIYRYTLESDTKNLMELSEIQRWIVIPALQQVPGVADGRQFRRLHPGIPARSRSHRAAALRRRNQRRHQRDQQQQRQCGRRPGCRAATRVSSSAASGWCATSTTSAISW